MTNPPPGSPADTFAAIVGRLIHALETWRIAGLLAVPLKILVTARIMTIRDRLRRLADRVAAGTYRPRRRSAGPRRPPADPHPRRPSPLPTRSGWLLKLVPHEMYRVAVAGCRSELGRLLRDDPEMAALMQAAPLPMRRPLRSLCRMLAITPPPVLALPRRPSRRSRVPLAPAAAPRKPQPRHSSPRPSPPAPAPMSPPPARACGPPRRRPA